jgi:hypothetical protein
VVTATVRIPAADAAAMPIGASSNATQSAGATPSRLAASRNTSGQGLPRATSSPRTMTSSAGSRQISRSVCCTFSEGADVAMATGIDRPRSAAMSRSNPGSGTRRPAESER